MAMSPIFVSVTSPVWALVPFNITLLAESLIIILTVPVSAEAGSVNSSLFVNAATAFVRKVVASRLPVADTSVNELTANPPPGDWTKPFVKSILTFGIISPYVKLRPMTHSVPSKMHMHMSPMFVIVTAVVALVACTLVLAAVSEINILIAPVGALDGKVGAEVVVNTVINVSASRLTVPDVDLRWLMTKPAPED